MKINFFNCSELFSVQVFAKVAPKKYYINKTTTFIGKKPYGNGTTEFVQQSRFS